MEEKLTTDQQAEIILNQIVEATKNKIIKTLEPAFDKLSNGHYHFTKQLADAILTDIKNVNINLKN